MREGDTLYWVWLGLRCTPGSETLDTLVRLYDSPFDMYSLEEDELRRIFGKKTNISRLCDKSLDSAQRILDFCFINDIGIVTYGSDMYPKRLKALLDPPPVLYYKGKFPNFNGNVSIAVVGTRQMSEYGKRMTFEISMDLARAGAYVVSGLALGVDGTAAAGAITGGGTTVAVLGCGIDIVYPSQHITLARAVAANGAVITEFSPGTRPEGRNFPLRNRIISGLCQGTLVIEGNRKSGAMITARYALKQGRALYALPGHVDDVNSESVNILIKDGARVVTCADDILKEFEYLYPGKINMFNLLKKTSVDVDAVLARLGVCSSYTKSRNISDRADAYNEQNRKSQFAKPQTLKKRAMSHAETGSGSLNSSASPSPENEAKLKTLDIATLNIYNLIPKERSVSPDELCSDERGISEVMTALTVLEICRLIKSEPGGRFSRV